jgi:hypothetical protein
MVSVRVAVLVAFLGGLVVGGLVVGATTPQAGAIDPDDPPYSVATGTGCIDDPGGWAFTTPTQRGHVAVVNLTVAHGPGERVETALTATGDGRYRFVVTPVTTDKRGSPDCPTGSTVEFGGTFSADFRSLTVVFDGRTVGTVSAEDGPAYRPLTVP